MKKNIIFALVIVALLIVVIWLAVTLAGPAGAVYVPDVSGYDPNVDYMRHMVAAAEDGSPWALAMGQIYERCRNEKIEDMKLAYEKTNFFAEGDAQKARDGIKAYLAPPVVEPEDPRAGWQSLGVWDITAYTWTGNPCANGEYPYEGVCAVNGLPFGTVIYVDGWGYLTVADRGGMDGWYDVDIYLDSEAACWEYGRRAREVWIVG